MIDLRSDTVTQPTEAMREAMNAAPVGDDSRDGDPTVRQLEELAAAKTGKEASLFLPSGTMANLVALLAHTGRGGEVLLERQAHIIRSEMGGIAHLAGLFHRALPGHAGAIDLERLRAAISPGFGPSRLGTALICLETTHNDAGGRVLPLAYLAEVRALAQEHGIPVHVDGARLFNAAVALGVGADEIARHVDTVCFCVSKGLSAPVGALLCGSRAFVEKSKAYRRMVGGAMRQSGIVAAAGIVALEQMVDRLAEDHRTARLLAEGIHGIAPGLVDPSEVETNILFIALNGTGRSAIGCVEALKARGVLAGFAGPARLRLVTNRHITEADAEQAIAVFTEVLGEVRQTAEAAIRN
jgi:threonine aldolase